MRMALAGWSTGEDFFRFRGKYITHAANLGADGRELFFKALVAAVHVVDAVDDGLAFSHQGGEHERCRGAKIGAHDGGGGETRRTAHGGDVSLDLDVGAHANQFLHMHESV